MGLGNKQIGYQVKECGCFQWVFFNSTKEINRLRKEINRLLIKGMPNIYLNVTIEKNWRSQNFKFKKFVIRSAFGELQLTQISFNFKILLKNCVWLFYYFNFESNYDVLKSKKPCILLKKNKNFNKNKMESKMETSTHSFTLCFSSYKNCKLKVKLCWSSQKKKEDTFVPFVLSMYRLFCPKEIFFVFIFCF